MGGVIFLWSHFLHHVVLLFNFYVTAVVVLRLSWGVGRVQGNGYSFFMRSLTGRHKMTQTGWVLNSGYIVWFRILLMNPEWIGTVWTVSLSCDWVYESGLDKSLFEEVNLFRENQSESGFRRVLALVRCSCRDAFTEVNSFALAFSFTRLCSAKKDIIFFPC